MHESLSVQQYSRQINTLACFDLRMRATLRLWASLLYKCTPYLRTFGAAVHATTLHGVFVQCMGVSVTLLLPGIPTSVILHPGLLS